MTLKLRDRASADMKIGVVLIAVAVAGTITFLFWWKSECDARRAPCTIEAGPITFRIGGDTK